MTARPAVAIAGATGRLGAHVADAFLSAEFLPSFSNIILLTRRIPDPIPNSWANAKVVTYDESNLVEALSGVDVVVSTYVAKDPPFFDRCSQRKCSK